MIGLLVVTHSGLAAELVGAALKIVRREVPIAALTLDWDDDVARARERIAAEIERLDHGEGVIIATDMFGGTPTNVAMSFFQPGKVEVVTGVNLPMLIKFTNLREPTEPMSLRDAAQLLAEKGRSAITVAGEILSGAGPGPESA
ncbi:MAG: PTS sugar transporter subunit IIA [Acidobacteria bacterium]|nr:PTS sugar transporter subunit IIA [Acidobacteriota bacterium]